MRDACRLIWCALIGLFRSRAEILVLRHQAQRPATQVPETSGPRQHRPAVACGALSPGSQDARRSQDHQASDAAALAPCRVSSLLALEIATARRSAATPADIRRLIREMSIAKPLWGAPRIHGE